MGVAVFFLLFFLVSPVCSRIYSQCNPNPIIDRRAFTPQTSSWRCDLLLCDASNHIMPLFDKTVYSNNANCATHVNSVDYILCSTSNQNYAQKTCLRQRPCWMTGLLIIAKLLRLLPALEVAVAGDTVEIKNGGTLWPLHPCLFSFSFFSSCYHCPFKAEVKELKNQPKNLVGCRHLLVLYWKPSCM